MEETIMFFKKKRVSELLLVALISSLAAVPSQVFADTGARHAAVGTDVFLGGNYIEIGISGSGSFGSAGAAPTGFHPTGRTNLGFNVDADGYDTGTPMNSGDYFLPGSPYEAFYAAYRSDSAAGATHI